MNILIVGYGRMGHEVEKTSLNRGHTIVGRIDPSGCGDAERPEPRFLEKCDMVIEFSQPQGILENIKLYADHKVSALVGTTGWLDRKDLVEKIILDSKIGFIYGSNFSIGAHIFSRLSGMLARLINPFPDYDIMVTEYHHKFKKDSPSGTAFSVAGKILENSSRKTEIVTDRVDGQIGDHQLHVASVRGGYIPGTHIVDADSPVDTIELRHTARERGGFVSGAVYAAEWLLGKTGIYSVDDFIQDIFQRGGN